MALVVLQPEISLEYCMTKRRHRQVVRRNRSGYQRWGWEDMKEMSEAMRRHLNAKG